MSDLKYNINEFKSKLEKSMNKTKGLISEKKYDDIPVKLSSQFQCQKIQDKNPFIKNQQQQKEEVQDQINEIQQQCFKSESNSNIQQSGNQYSKMMQQEQQICNDDLIDQEVLMTQCFNCRQFEQQIQQQQMNLQQLDQSNRNLNDQVQKLQYENKYMADNYNQKYMEFEKYISNLQQQLIQSENNLQQNKVVVDPQHLQQIQELNDKLAKKKSTQDKQCKKIKQLEQELSQFQKQKDHYGFLNNEFEKTKQKLNLAENALNKVQKQSENQIKELQNKLKLEIDKNYQNEKDNSMYSQEQKLMEAQIDQELVNLKQDNSQKELKIKQLKNKLTDVKSKLEIEYQNNKQKIDQYIQDQIQNREMIAGLQGENNSLQEKVIVLDSELQELRVFRTKSDQTELLNQVREELREKKQDLEIIREKYENILIQNQNKTTEYKSQQPIYIEKEKPVYIEKPIYIDKIIEKPVVQEKIVEKIVYVDKPQIQEKVVDRPIYIEVEKPIYIEKEKPSDDQHYLQKIQELVNQNKQKIEEIRVLKLKINELESVIKNEQDKVVQITKLQQQYQNDRQQVIERQTVLQPQQNDNRSVSPAQHVNVPVFQPQQLISNCQSFSIDQIKQEMNQIKNSVIRQNKFVV